MAHIRIFADGMAGIAVIVFSVISITPRHVMNHIPKTNNPIEPTARAAADDYKKSKGLIMQLDALIEAASHQADPADPQKPSGG